MEPKLWEEILDAWRDGQALTRTNLGAEEQWRYMAVAAQEVARKFYAATSAPAPREPTPQMMYAIGLQGYGPGVAEKAWTVMWDAWSASAPAAPRVGDDPRTLKPVAWVCNPYPTRPNHRVVGMVVEWTADMQFHNAIDQLKAAWGALSAPPAASADEREEFARDIIEASVKHGPYLMPHQTAAYLAALGYRKLAPAQSVGQSAAQGVGDGAHPLDEVIDRLENGIGMNHTEAFVLGCKHSIEIARRVRQEHLNLIARNRLSALPKGQDDE